MVCLYIAKKYIEKLKHLCFEFLSQFCFLSTAKCFRRRGGVALQVEAIRREDDGVGEEQNRVDHVAELPLVISDKIQSYTKTKEAHIFLKKSKAYSDIEQVYKSKRFRAGKGKMRDRKRIMKKGPLVIYDQDQVIYS